MPGHKTTAMILSTLIIILSVPLHTARFDNTNISTVDDFATSDSVYDVTITILKVHVVEDRDFFAAEIYVIASIDGGSKIRSNTYPDINDGDVIQLNWMIFEGRRSNYTIRVEVWESDEGFDDYLGHVEYSRDPPINHESWYDAVGSIGGDNNLQARVLISETAYLDLQPRLNKPVDKTFSEGTTGHLIQWIGFDDNPDSYNVTRDGELIDTGSWATEVPIVCDLEGLPEGEYNYHIVVNDTDGYEAEDSVHVTVTEPVTTSTSTTTTETSTTTTTTTTTETSTTTTTTTTIETTPTTTTTETTLDLSDLWTYSVMAVVGIIALVVIITVARRR
ncbi:MAG: hypothetical protein RTV31_10025 [Candidatus Thorarchaeota archaeon]